MSVESPLTSSGCSVPAWTNDEAYDRFMGPWSKASGREFAKWLAAPDCQRWLDVGCGTGAFTEVIFTNCAPSEIIGIDPAEAHLLFARRRLSDGRIKLEVASALAIPYPDNVFDIAASALVLNFVPNQAKMVMEMARVVRPSGTVALYVWDFAGGGAIAQHFAMAMAALYPQAAKRAAALQQAETTTIQALSRIFDSADLTEVCTATVEIDVVFVGFDDYWASNTEFMSPIGQFVAELASSERSQFKKEVRARLPIAADGSIRYKARIHAIRGKVCG